jgi:FkbH-like protein
MNTALNNNANFDEVIHIESDAKLFTKIVKCVIWDLDNTIWDGILVEGDDVRLKPGIPEILSILDSRGILHSVASKNNYDDAMSKLKTFGIDHYFLFPQIGWDAKSFGIAKIQKDLNIGMDSLLFIDDQMFEVDEVATAHPAINWIVAEKYQGLPSDPRLNPKVVAEDAHLRRLRYLEAMVRQRDEEEFNGTPEEFLVSLDMKFRIATATHADLLRAEELTVRTNQLNSTGITYSFSELAAYIRSESHQLLICELTDKYGSYGKIGLVLVERQARCDRIKLLLMSCRTVSRGLGGVLLTYLMQQAARDGKELLADFRRTERNRQMLVTYQFGNFREVERTPEGLIVFANNLDIIPDYPPYIQVFLD